MHRVCFVIPPSAFLLDERVFVSLGVLKVASALEARGYSVEVLDLSGVANYEEVAELHAARGESSTFALTATTPQMPAAARVHAALVRGRPTVRTIVGGPHPTLALAAVKKNPGNERAGRALARLRDMFDVVVAGDGEDSIVQALAAPARLDQRGGRCEGVVIDADDPGGPLFLTKKRMDELPPPARHLVDLDSYHYTIDGVRATSLIAQLGCPFACAFCGGRASPMLRRARIRSTDQVLAELEHLHVAHGYQGFMFYDDEMNVSKEMNNLMRGISALAKKHRTEFRLRGFVKAELFTQEQAYACYEAGFRWLLCGFESAHPRILDNINKRATVADNDRMLTLARAAGIRVKALMSIGHAGESADTVEAVKRWLLSRRVDDFDCTIITPYPGSPYYDDAVQNVIADRAEVRGVWTYTSPRSGDRLHAFEIDYMQEADYYKSTKGAYVSHVFTDHLVPEELVALRDDLEDSVRAELKIPFNAGTPGLKYEATMGQLPSNILRSSA